MILHGIAVNLRVLRWFAPASICSVRRACSVARYHSCICTARTGCMCDCGRWNICLCLNRFDFATEGYVRCTGGMFFLIDVFWTYSLYNVARCSVVFAQCRRAEQLSSSCVVCVIEKHYSVR